MARTMSSSAATDMASNRGEAASEVRHRAARNRAFGVLRLDVKLDFRWPELHLHRFARFVLPTKFNAALVCEEHARKGMAGENGGFQKAIERDSSARGERGLPEPSPQAAE